VAKLFDASGKLTDENPRQHIPKFLEAFARWIAALSPSRRVQTARFSRLGRHPKRR